MQETRASGRTVRRSAHSVDIDFYRTRTTALRGAARRDAAAVLAVVSACALTMAGALTIVLLFSAAPIPAPSSHAVMARTIAMPVR